MNPGVRKILGGVILILLALAFVSRMTNRPSTPLEKDRVRHPAGLSIIMPAGWFNEMDVGAVPQIRMYPREQAGPQVSLIATRFASKPSGATDLPEDEFQAKPARMGKRKDGRMNAWRVVFERDGQWYQVSAVTPPDVSMDDGWLRSYAESFKVEASAGPATQMIVVPE